MVEQTTLRQREKECGEQRGKADAKHETVEKFSEQALRFQIQPSDGRDGVPRKGSGGQAVSAH